MDLVLDFLDPLVFDQMYSSLGATELTAERGNWKRQFFSLYLITAIGGAVLYFLFSGINYFFFFDMTYTKHPKFLKNQVRREILTTVGSIPFMTLLTAPIFTLEVFATDGSKRATTPSLRLKSSPKSSTVQVRGYSKLLDGSEYGIYFDMFTVLSFLMFTDMCIYWIHRYLHHPLIYPYVHKQHHLWKVPTPWASHAFHPLDGFAQSTPYHIYAFLFPMNKVLYLVMFVFVNMWTISIHDGIFLSFDGFLNSSAHHAEHHLHFTVNYGQYFTLWDRLFGTHKQPDYPALDPHKVVAQKEKANGAALHEPSKVKGA